VSVKVREQRSAPGKVSGRGADEAPGMQTNPTHPIRRGVDPDELHWRIAEMYRDVANEVGTDLHFPTGRSLAEALGYSTELLDQLPAGAVNSFVGVGYHFGLARLLPGERVLDLGSGSGMDVFAAAVQVGPQGGVTGIDITPEQLIKAERLVRDEHVSFRHARIEELSFDDGSFDVVISNGVVNLSPDKRRVFAEIARVLRAGGRLALADIVMERQIAERTACQAELWAACIAGASQTEQYLADIAAAGLELQLVQPNSGYRFTSERARRTSEKYGAHSISLLALNPVRAARHPSSPDLGDGADVARAASEEGSTNTTTTQEVSQ
jgi:arsenite methyltransferase